MGTPNPSRNTGPSWRGPETANNIIHSQLGARNTARSMLVAERSAASVSRISVDTRSRDLRNATVLDLRKSMVRRLAQFACYCRARDHPEVASKGLACLLVLAIKSAAPALGRRLQAELARLGFRVSARTVAKYRVPGILDPGMARVPDTASMEYMGV